MIRKKKDNDEPFEGDEKDEDFDSRRRDFFGRDPFDDLFGDFHRVDEMMNELMRNMFSGKIKFEGSQPFVYGFSLKTGPDGKPVFEEFGNVKPGAKPLVSDAREPLVDVMDKDDQIIVIAELPGVGKKDIDLEASGKSLEIKVDMPNRKFYKQVELPAEVFEDATDATYNNGVLEVKLKKKHVEKKTKRIQIR